jgi:hypothetical protein
VVGPIVLHISFHIWQIQKFEAHYLEMDTTASAQKTCVKQGKANCLKKLIHETQSSDKNKNIPTIAPSTWAKLWQADFMNYINTFKVPPSPGMSMIQWWDVHSFLLPSVSYCSSSI